MASAWYFFGSASASVKSQTVKLLRESTAANLPLSLIATPDEPSGAGSALTWLPVALSSTRTCLSSGINR